MSKASSKLFLAGAGGIVAVIRRGKRWPTVGGALVGALLGSTIGFLALVVMPATMLVGAIAGATIAAAMYQEPRAVLGARANEVEPFQLGGVIKHWTFESGDFKTITVLLEHGLYFVRHDGAPWDQVLQALSQGNDPGLPLPTVIRLTELERIERRHAQATELKLVCRVDKQTLRRTIDFSTPEVRDEFLAALESRYGRNLVLEEGRLDLWTSVRAPLIAMVIVVLVFGAVALLANHWTAHPPPPPRGKKEQDDLVKLLVWAGAQGVLLTGAIASIPAAAWLAARILYPPRLLTLWVKER